MLSLSIYQGRAISRISPDENLLLNITQVNMIASTIYLLAARETKSRVRCLIFDHQIVLDINRHFGDKCF